MAVEIVRALFSCAAEWCGKWEILAWVSRCWNESGAQASLRASNRALGSSCPWITTGYAPACTNLEGSGFYFAGVIPPAFWKSLCGGSQRFKRKMTQIKVTIFPSGSVLPSLVASSMNEISIYTVTYMYVCACTHTHTLLHKIQSQCHRSPSGPAESCPRPSRVPCPVSPQLIAPLLQSPDVLVTPQVCILLSLIFTKNLLNF